MLYSGKLGVSEQKEVRPGIWEDVITEYDVLGKVVQSTELLEQGDDILPRYRTNTSISVFARALGDRDNSDIRYITYRGKNWQVASDVSQPPRIVLYLREEYHGPTPE